MPKAKIRHIAISTDDPRKTADWYKAVFGLEEVGDNGRDGIGQTLGQKWRRAAVLADEIGEQIAERGQYA